ncbi:HEPN domain-containing protein [Candidatus Bathyarchaeota archaeon]|nr:HEPN domain-containing protein [Candidatus Bathyarchaeota archaeon]
MVDWQTELRNAEETLERAKIICTAGAYPEAVQNAIVSGELYLKTMLRKKGFFRESGRPNDKIHDISKLWDRVKCFCGLSAPTIALLNDVFIKLGSEKETLQYIDRTAEDGSYADCADLPATRYSTETATPEDFYDESYALEKISLADIVEEGLAPYFRHV